LSLGWFAWLRQTFQNPHSQNKPFRSDTWGFFVVDPFASPTVKIPQLKNQTLECKMTMQNSK